MWPPQPRPCPGLEATTRWLDVRRGPNKEYGGKQGPITSRLSHVTVQANSQDSFVKFHEVKDARFPVKKVSCKREYALIIIIFQFVHKYPNSFNSTNTSNKFTQRDEDFK